MNIAKAPAVVCGLLAMGISSVASPASAYAIPHTPPPLVVAVAEIAVENVAEPQKPSFPQGVSTEHHLLLGTIALTLIIWFGGRNSRFGGKS